MEKKSKSRRPLHHQLSPKSPISSTQDVLFKLERPLFETGHVELGLQDVADVLEVLKEPTIQQTKTDSSSQTDPIHPTGKTTIVENVSHTAGRLANFYQAWAAITHDRFVLECIKGYKITFDQSVDQSTFFTDNNFSKEEEKDLKEAIFKLKANGAIKECKPIQGQFISPYFLVLKPNGSKRFILNLRNLNKFIRTSHFKLEDLRTATKLISKDSFMCTLEMLIF